MHGFAYHRPDSLAEAASLAAGIAGARPLAGGMTLLPAMKLRLAQHPALIELGAVPGLAGISADAAQVTIGAMTTHAAVAASAEIAARLPALAQLAGGIGDPAVRHRGTIGGSIANADPAADYPAAVLGLGATLVTNAREIAADAFFTGLFATALAPGELLTAVRFPVPLAAGYAKFPNPASRYAVVGVFVARIADAVRVAVTGAGPCVFRVPAMETALARDFSPAALRGIAVPADGLNDDIHAEPAYRAHLIGVMAARAVAAANG